MMKHYIFLLFAVLFPLTGAFAQIPVKGTGVCYFDTKTDLDAFTPNTLHDCEVSMVTGATEFYCWNRGTSIWELCNPTDELFDDSALQTLIANNTNAINTNTTNINSNTSSINNHIANDNDTDSTNELDDTDISAVSATLSGTMLTVGVTEDGVTQTDTEDLSSLQYDDTAIQNQINNNATNISNNSTAISNNTTAINNNASDISNNATNIATNTTNISTNAGDISTNATNIAGNTTAINNHISNDADIVIGNEYNTGFTFNDATDELEITDGGGTLSQQIVSSQANNAIEGLSDGLFVQGCPDNACPPVLLTSSSDDPEANIAEIQAYMAANQMCGLGSGFTARQCVTYDNSATQSFQSLVWYEAWQSSTSSWQPSSIINYKFGNTSDLVVTNATNSMPMTIADAQVDIDAFISDLNNSVYGQNWKGIVTSVVVEPYPPSPSNGTFVRRDINIEISATGNNNFPVPVAIYNDLTGFGFTFSPLPGGGIYQLNCSSFEEKKWIIGEGCSITPTLQGFDDDFLVNANGTGTLTINGNDYNVCMPPCGGGGSGSFTCADLSSCGIESLQDVPNATTSNTYLEYDGTSFVWSAITGGGTDTNFSNSILTNTFGDTPHDWNSNSFGISNYSAFQLNNANTFFSLDNTASVIRHGSGTLQSQGSFISGAGSTSVIQAGGNLNIQANENLRIREDTWSLTPDNAPLLKTGTPVSGDNFYAGYGLPPTDGTNGQVLTTDGSGVVTWQSPASGTVYHEVQGSTIGSSDPTTIMTWMQTNFDCTTVGIGDIVFVDGIIDGVFGTTYNPFFSWIVADDGSGNCQLINIEEPDVDCVNKFQMPQSAFADPENPLTSELVVWAGVNTPQSGTVLLIHDSPNGKRWIWIRDCAKQFELLEYTWENHLQNVPSYPTTAAAAADASLLSDAVFKVDNLDGTSTLHIKN